MFQQEREKQPDNEAMTASELLARRFSDESANGFALLGRYERGQAMFLRLLNQFHKVGKIAEPNNPIPTSASPTNMSRRSRPARWFDRKWNLSEERTASNTSRRAIEREAQMDRALDTMAAQKKQTQTKPTKTDDSRAKTGISASSTSRRLRNEPNRTLSAHRRRV